MKRIAAPFEKCFPTDSHDGLGRFGLEGLAERCSLSGCDARSEARTQGVPIAVAIGATEDAAAGRAGRPEGIDGVSSSPPDRVRLGRVPSIRHTDGMDRARRHQRLSSALAFALLALVAELVGRSLAHRLDVGRHVGSSDYSGTEYYPFLLAAVKLGVAL